MLSAPDFAHLFYRSSDPGWQKAHKGQLQTAIELTNVAFEPLLRNWLLTCPDGRSKINTTCPTSLTITPQRKSKKSSGFSGKHISRRRF